MTVKEDILAELTVKQITEIIGERGQGDMNILKTELAEWVVVIKTTEDLIDKERKYGS